MKNGDIYKSNTGGYMEVVSFNGALSVEVRFLNTGYITTTRSAHVLSGSVRDKSLLVKVGDVFESNQHGQFTVIKCNGSTSIDVKFLATGTVTSTDSSNIRKGSVKDHFVPSVFGVGFFGAKKYTAKKTKRTEKCYVAWYAMMTRCYSERYHETRPTYIGCSVCEEWHNYQNFSVWYHDNYPKDGKEYQIDKDIKKDGNRVYCPELCIFVTLAVNNVKAQALHYKFVSPLGVVTKIYNMAKFCRDNWLDKVLMGRVNNNKQPQHKGWAKA